MKLSIIAPSGVICQTEVDSVTMPGEVGMFTVLKNHAPLISSLTAGELMYVEDGKEHRLNVLGGFARVYNNEIEVAVEIPKK